MRDSDDLRGTDVGSHEGPANLQAFEAQGDDGFSGLKLFLKAGLELGHQAENLAKRVDSLNARLQRNAPVDYRPIASGVFVTGTPLVLNLGSPDIGTYWEVMSLSVGGTEVNVAAAGNAGVYVSGMPSLAGAGMTNLQALIATMPASPDYGTRQLVVKPEESLFLVIFGGTNGQQYVASCTAAVYSVITESSVEVTS